MRRPKKTNHNMGALAYTSFFCFVFVQNHMRMKFEIGICWNEKTTHRFGSIHQTTTVCGIRLKFIVEIGLVWQLLLFQCSWSTARWTDGWRVEFVWLLSVWLEQNEKTAWVLCHWNREGICVRTCRSLPISHKTTALSWQHPKSNIIHKFVCRAIALLMQNISHQMKIKILHIILQRVATTPGESTRVLNAV